MPADEVRDVAARAGLAATAVGDARTIDTTVAAGVARTIDTTAAAGVARTIDTTAAGGERSATTAAIPAAMGRYRIVRRIGAGGMGVVYEAHDPQLDRPVAIKVLHERVAARAHLAERLHREARALARVTHANVVSVHDVGVDGGEVYVVMQFVAGETLEAALARDPADRRTVLARFDAAGRGLAAAHAAGLVHRDFKPSNVLVDTDGTVRVTDFGLARVSDLAEEPAAIGGELAMSMTRGELVGTPAYMAPEQFRGGPITAATDQFSFCVALWQALCGARPFAGGDLDTIRAAVLAGAVEPPPAGRLPRRIERVLRRGLALEPAARFPSMTALLDELAPRRRAWLVGGLAVGGAGALALVGWAALAPHGGGHAPRAAPIALPPPVAERAPAPPPAPLTHLGGCAYSPTFVDTDTVVFDLTRAGADDLYRLELPAAGGALPAPRQLTSDDGWEWRASPGKPPDEVVFLRQGGARDGTESLDLVTGARRPLTDIGGPIVYARGAYFHAPARGTVLRRIDDRGDQIFLQLPDGRSADTMVASPDGSRLAILFRKRGSAGLLCTLPLDHPEQLALACLPPSPEGGRVAFSADGAALYFDAGLGIDRVELAGGAVGHAVADVSGAGGIAVAPGGGALVFSDCKKRGAIRDLAADGDGAIAPGDLGHPAVGPGNTITYLRAAGPRQTIVVRRPDGHTDDVLTRDGAHINALAISADGQQLAFVATGGPEPGIFLVKITSSRAEVNRVTEGAAEEQPVFAGGRLIFTRRAADGAPQLFAVGLDGSGEQLASPRPRVVIGVDHAHGRVLLSSPGRDHLYWWDARTGAESPGPRLPIDDVSTGISVSPGGGWLLLLTGNNGQMVYRFALGGRRLIPELVRKLPADVTALLGAIDDRGHAIVQTDTWAGELWLAPPAEGARW